MPVFHRQLCARKMAFGNTPLPIKIASQRSRALCHAYDCTARTSWCYALRYVALPTAALLLPRRQASAVSEEDRVDEYRVTMPKPSYAQLGILLIPAAFLVAYLGVCALLRLVELELPLWLKIVWSVYIVIMLHVSTMGLLGALWLDVPIERISFGFGKRWLQTNIAGIPISFGIPLGGWVKFACDELPRTGVGRVAIELSGCAVLIVLAAVIWGRHASYDVLALWQQYFAGALSPFDHAQVLLADLGRYLAGLDELSILAAVSFGMAALHLLPVPTLNGGRAIMYFVSSTIYPLTDRAQEWLFRVGLFIIFPAVVSWCLALLFLAYDSWARPLIYS